MQPVGAHGQGGITKRADGRLMVSITLYDGRRIVRYVAKDRDAARQRRLGEKLRRELVAMREQDLEPERQTLGDYLNSWIGALRDARKPLAVRTLEHYTYVVEDYIIPALGGITIDRLSERHIQVWLDADTGSARSVHHHRAVLRRALNVAVKRRLITRNPAVAVDLPDLTEFRGAPLTVAEAKRLLAVPGRLAPLWRLAIATGFRQSELLGLGWDDLDLDAGTVTLRHQLLRVGREWRYVTTKAARSVERVSVDAGTVAALRDHRAAMAAERQPSWRFHGLVFVTPAGEPLGRADVLRHFHAACEAAGIPRRRFHDLRSSSATLMAEAGVPEHVRMARLGHATTAMARHYAQVGDVLDREASDALGRMLA